MTTPHTAPARARAQRRPPLPGRLRGLSLIELMIGIVVGMIILLAMSTVFVNSSSARRELQLSADALENGRYAIDLLTRDLAQTGYFGTLATTTGAAVVPADMCNQTLATWQDTLSTHVVGYQDGGYPACISGSAKAGTDAVFVQRASTCAVGEAACAPEVNTEAYLQVSECGFEYSTTPFLVAAGGGGNGVFKLQSRPCNGSGFSIKRRLIRRIYYVNASNELVYQAIPLGPANTYPAPVVLVEGVEDLQIEYAVDTNNNGSVDDGEFVANPADWSQVIGVRLGVLSASAQAGRTPTGARTFELPGKSIDRADDRVKRRAYSTTILFESPTARRQS